MTNEFCFVFFKDYYELVNIFGVFQITAFTILMDNLGNWETVPFWDSGAFDGFLISWRVSGSIHIFPAPDMESIISPKSSGFFNCEMDFGYYSLGRVLTNAWLGLSNGYT